MRANCERQSEGRGGGGQPDLFVFVKQLPTLSADSPTPPSPPLSPTVAPTPVEVVMIDGKRRCQLLGVLRALKQRQPTAEFRYR